MNNVTEFASLALLAAKEAALRKIVLGAPSDPTVLRAQVTLKQVGGKPHLQLETFYTDGKARHQNLTLDKEGETRLAEIAGGFSRIHLLTTAGDAEVKQSKKGEVVFLGADKLRRRLQSGNAEAVAIADNNKQKKHILTGKEPFLRLLDVADENGRVFDKKQSKFRQINRFLELVRDTLPHLPEKRIVIADLCCGKSYLSFAVYHYFANVLGCEVTMTGVDLKPDVIAHCSAVAEKLGFKGLSFVCGDVAAFKTDLKPHLVVSLHACDTATDLVLQKAMEWEARVILSTPCCHHELSHTLNCPTLSFIAEHAMLRQKLCDAATDAMRLKLLEANGYRVAALELIDPDDTPKNVMLRATRRADADKDTPAKKKAMEEYLEARRFLLGGDA